MELFMTDTLLSRDDEPNWYFRVVDYPLTEFRRLGEDGLSNIFIPVEGLSNYSLADTTPVRWEQYPGLSEEDNLVSFYAYVSMLSAQDVYTTTLFRVDLNGMFQVYLSEWSKDKTDREELANEIRKITRYVWFTSEEVFYAFIQRACPLLYSQIDRWKLLTELKEYSREIRVAEK